MGEKRREKGEKNIYLTCATSEGPRNIIVTSSINFFSSLVAIYSLPTLSGSLVGINTKNKYKK
jgi:hypothetical protein